MESNHEHHHTENCRELLGSLSDYVDGSLGKELCEELERHMSGCENCKIVVDTLRKTIYLYHSTASTPNVPSGVRERLYQKLHLDDYIENTR